MKRQLTKWIDSFHPMYLVIGLCFAAANEFGGVPLWLTFPASLATGIVWGLTVWRRR